MPSLYRSAAALALAGAAFANPLKRGDDACLAAVTGKAALGDDSLRKEHCSSFIKTIVTPSAVTVTTTITDAPVSSQWSQWKRDQVTVCPNEVPNYASACDAAGYKSACKVYGISGETTITIPATTTTKTVYVGNGGWGSGNGGVCTSTAFVTETLGASTVTVTQAVQTVTVTVTPTGNHGTGPTDAPGLPGLPSGNCLTDDKAKVFTDAFTDLLEYTSYNGTKGAPGRGYHYNVSKTYLAEDFKDYSDSINWMAGFPLGGVTFDGRAAFDYGQGVLQPELSMDTKFVHHSCKDITWKWVATTQTGAKVMGINHMILNDDLTQIQENHAEFDNAAWLSSFGLQCSVPAAPASRH